MSNSLTTYDVEREVLQRYRSGAEAVEPALCCPTTHYEADYLKVLPAEIIEKDYGCGNPERHVQAGETVVDLGSGAGKIAYILAQKVGQAGRVIGVDFNDAMLSLARKHQPAIAGKLGYDNVRFVKGRIQDLALDVEAVDAWMSAHPLKQSGDLAMLDAACARLRQEAPLIATETVDVVVSNCVLNLVRPQDKAQLFGEIFRILKRGGRAVISDIVCDEAPTQAILDDPELWSGCIAGAFREDRFLAMFEEAGFHGIEVLARQEEPWRVIDGVEFRSLTVRAFKGKQGPCLEANQAVIYKGPWKAVTDDDGHTYRRGERMVVCDKIYHLLTGAGSAYAGQLIGIPPRETVDLSKAATIDCRRNAVRDPRETKGLAYRETMAEAAGACCEPGGNCG
ncbi:MAG: methyltransferase domain-containing protein [Verrucomicrobia bacterium]|nr:methyltransferase domain-containing protein [Verrucomicrobiota bacterium]